MWYDRYRHGTPTREVRVDEEHLRQEELRQLMMQRAFFYTLLARLFQAEATPDMLDQMPRRQADLHDADADFVAGLALLHASLAERNEEAAAGIAADFKAIFHGSVRGLPVYPFESAYVEGPEGESRDARQGVQAHYEAAGLSVLFRSPLPADHVSVELTFMAQLGLRAAEGLRAYDDAELFDALQRQQVFLVQHPLRWLPAFCQDVARLAQHDFYKGIARLTVGFLHADEELMGELAGPH